MNNASNRLRGLAAALTILALVVGAPIVLLAIDATPWTENWSEFRTMLSSPDDGSLALLAMGSAAWIFWAVAAASVAVEIVAAIRGVQAPHLPGLGGPQRLVGELVTAAAVLFATATAVVPTFTPQPVQAATAPAAAAVTAPRAMASPVVVEDSPVAHPPSQEAPTVSYVVRRGDSLWKIAEERLGDGNRYRDIVALNRDALHGEPSFIDAGLVLQLPADAAPEAAYVVEPGDTLSEIAEDELGDAERYPEIVKASRSTLQPDGQHLTDPDLIRPGWHLTVPAETPDPPVPAQPDAPESGALAHQGKHLIPPAPLAPAAEPSSPGASATSRVVTTQSDQGMPVAAWVLPGLLGAGAILASSLWLVGRGQRRTQQRYRRPGHTIAPVPAVVRDVEKTARLVGQPLAESMEAINRLLIDLRAKTGERPRLTAAELTPHDLRLHFAQPVELPEPWAGAGATWAASLAAPVPEHDNLCPYPMLVSVGIDNEGHLWLLDLESIGALSVSGDPDHCADFGRHLVADLALSPWADITEIGTVDLAPEFASINGWHLQQHFDGGEAYLARMRGLFAEPATMADPEPMSVVLLPAAVLATNPDAQGLIEIVRTQPGRPGLAVVSIGEQHPEAVSLHVAAAGRLTVAGIDRELAAAGLTSPEAEACAALVNLTLDASQIVPVPRQRGATEGWRALADSAGALVPECVEERPAGVAGQRSVLPEATQRYETVAATTATDIDTLAPLVSDDTKARILEADPDLDRDLADWADPDSRRPKLQVLGPVSASGKGAVVPKINERRSYYAELTAYLALHPNGVTAAEIHDVFGIQQSRARSDVSLLREWFGDDPQTGEPFLPRGASGGRGGSYKIHNALVDLDLFRRLRLRAQAKGASGMDDLVACLDLVNGEPFSALRKDGWSWMLDDERLYEIASAAVVDVAHIVTVDALSHNDLERAARAAETACRAAPYDEIARLDLAKVAEAQGDHERAEKIIRDDVCNRSDDGQAPIDLPERSAELLDDRRRNGDLRKHGAAS